MAERASWNGMWWGTSIILTLRRLRQEDYYKSGASLGDISRPSTPSKTNKKKNNKIKVDYWQ